MKSRRWLTLAALASCCGALLVAIHAAAQPGPGYNTPTLIPRVVTERTPDGKDITRHVIEARTSGTSPFANDPEVQQVLQSEVAAAADARKLAEAANFGDSEGERDDAKDKLREKLVEIFDLQQKRRAHEIARIEERLGKLKETMTKRDAAKDSIVDRRLEVLTGGVDELGWEETGSQRIPGGEGYNPYRPSPYAPSTVPILPPRPRVTGPGPGVTDGPQPGISLPGPPSLPAPVPVNPTLEPSLNVDSPPALPEPTLIPMDTAPDRGR